MDLNRASRQGSAAESSSSSGGGGGGGGRDFVEKVVRGVRVKFPFEPYGVQMAYMSKLLSAVEAKGNFALLESPTGTGKTLAILSALLGWQETQKERLKHAHGRVNSGVNPLDTAKANNDPRPPVIIYASRTHSQLSQVVQELKRTAYRPRVTILSSRDNMCVHPEVQQKRGTDMRHTCRMLTKAHACRYHEKVEQFLSNLSLDGNSRQGFLRDENSDADESAVFRRNMIMDIEELGNHSQRQGVCPYFLSRAKPVQEAAEIVFMPYNYLVNASTRQGLDVRWANSIIVVDEAHNLEQVCDEATSFSLSGGDLAQAIDEIDETAAMLEDNAAQAAGSNPDGLTLERVAQAKQIVMFTEDKLRSLALSTISNMGNVVGKALPGDAIFSFFPVHHQGIKGSEVEECLALFKAIQDYHARAAYLEKYVTAFERALAQTSQLPPDHQAITYYRTFVREEAIKSASGQGQGQSNWGRAKAPVRKTRTLNFWCFSPGVALSELQAKSVHSIILTSGTLAPLSSFAAQMRTPFPVQLENPHVVKARQVLVRVVGKGISGKKLTSTYQHRDSPAYLSELGNTIASFVRVVPDGMLVFFPSYHTMQTALRAWREGGILRTIKLHKDVFEEARNAADMGKVVERYEEAIAAGRGGLFFAVCRGKASEGIDFSNSKARAVVITGLPYPPKVDPQVVLKWQFLDQQKPDPARPMSKLSGQDWYGQQAYRAVNQAIGRVIRHRNDYGAILLCDERFGYESTRRSISMWLRNKVQVAESFDGVNKELVDFFKTNLADRGLNQSKSSAGRSGGTSLSSSSSASSAARARANDNSGPLSLNGSRSDSIMQQDRRGKMIQIGSKRTLADSHGARSSANARRPTQPGGDLDLESLLNARVPETRFEDAGARNWVPPKLTADEKRRKEADQERRLEEQRRLAEKQRKRRTLASEEERQRVNAKLERERKEMTDRLTRERKRKRLEQGFNKPAKQRDAGAFMKRVKANLATDAYERFKVALKKIRTVRTGRYDDEEMMERALPFLRTMHETLSAATSGMDEQFLVELAQYMPLQFRALYKRVVFDQIV
ncbi:Regulator of telomere elongation helicase 1 [Hondaea fermentalgiana]|uniref:Regulator of telomere elongation helicase 1 homolog n=1 Tax=Hondaea fermentalgiana TaxID=2315210 RepID=A0A2R5GNK6_9STRA|nr:Regulator of telomere elongation helicase 1 [Hondaea fermentalgiana]|eukprot:GBG29891.1 Regulator of telomere elongation helicase 1 [Hondaea fermentalgiana]